MSDYFRQYATTECLISIVFILFVFLVPEASAYTLYFSPSEYTANEDDGSVFLEIKLDDADVINGDCRVIGEVLVKESSTAQQGKDFEIVDGAFDLFEPGDWINDLKKESIDAWSTSRSVSQSSDSIEIKIFQDSHEENDETIELVAVRSSESGGCSFDNTKGEATVTIVDDDFIGPNAIRHVFFEKKDYTINENDGIVTLVLNSIDTYGESVTASLSTKNGTAINGEDYVGISNEIIEFTGSQTKHEVPIKINSDHVVEDNESFIVDLTDSNGGQSSTKVTIFDSTTPGISSFKSKTFTGKEGSSAEIQVIREQGSDGELSVELEVGGEGDTATAGKDYTKPESTRLTWAAGDSETKTISIPLLTDGEEDIDEQVSLRLLQEGELLDSAILTIENITPSNPGVASFVHRAFTGDEGGSAEIQVMREQGSDGELSVELEVGGEGDTATAGKDYKKPESTQLTWVAGDTEPKTITIPVLKDGVEDVDEKVSLRLLQGGEVLDSATLIIKDKTDPGVVSFTSKTFSGEEGGGG